MKNQFTTNLPLPRRTFLKQTGAGLIVAGASFGFPAIVSARHRTDLFQHGVASGDPLSDAVVIWTRVTPTEDATPGSGRGHPVAVRWEVAKDPSFRHKVEKGVALATAAFDHVVKVDVCKLRPGTEYYYRFLCRNEVSPVGRTRTAPAANAAVPSLRFGLCSCSNFEGGFFSAYRHLAGLAQRDRLDFILHVGDYIYEYQPGAYGPGAAIGRVHSPASEILTLEDYRQRHAQYKADPDLQALHAAAPFICTWDDHEVTNDAYEDGAENHQPDTEGDYLERRNRAYRAYFEWMPIRRPQPLRNPARIYRQFSFGSLADLNMLDLRQYRDLQPANGLDPAKDHPDRELMGREQLDWLKENLGASGARWKLVGNSVMITPVDFRQPLPPGLLEQLGLMMGVPFNVDSWDGYTADRHELLEHLLANDIKNVAFLTGDIHSSWGCEVPLDTSVYPAPATSAAVELVGTSITSDNLNEIFGLPPRSPLSLQAEALFKAGNPHIKLLEFDSHGFSVVEVTESHLQIDWHYISDRADQFATSSYAGSAVVPEGSNKVLLTNLPLPPRG